MVAIVTVLAFLTITPELLWLLSADGPWLSWLPTDRLVAGLEEEFWRRMALGMFNCILLAGIATAVVLAWQKWDGHAHGARH
jgi:hypothetical protein